MRVLLISTYELGHQPLHAASPAGALRRAGHDVRCLDLSVEEWDPATTAWADAVAFSVPMHTAMRLAVAGARRLRGERPGLPVCFYGLYAPVGRDTTVGTLADRVIAGEYEPALVAWASGAEVPPEVIQLGRGRFGVPARDLLPPLDLYARLSGYGDERLVGSVEASHGCVHRCRHCPVPVVYDGRIRIVGEDAVLADVEQLVAMGARHLTFGDPDFLNGPNHARRVVDAVHGAFPDLTFDCTVKVEHILAHTDLWRELGAAGLIFVVSAFESVDDAVLARLDKGHTAADASAAVRLLRRSGIEIRPSWLPFTPWTTPGSLADLLEFVVAHDLADNVDPVQLTIRLLLPDGSLLLDHPELASHLGPYDPERLSWTWTAPDPVLDEIQRELTSLVEARVGNPGPDVLDEIGVVVNRLAGRPPRTAVPGQASRGPRGSRPRLTEPWFCCSEPTAAQVAPLVASAQAVVGSTPRPAG